MMKRLTLSQRLALVFASLLLLCTLLSGWMQIRVNAQYGSAVVQRLSDGLARHIASLNPNMIGENGVNLPLMKALFHDLMVLNPSVEVYLLDLQGNILADAAPPDHIKRTNVSLAPLHAQLQGATSPIYGDDPRNLLEKKVFSAAMLTLNNKPAGYLYVILQGENYHQLAQEAQIDILMRTSLWSSLMVVLFGLTAGAVAFSLITRPMRQLTQRVRQLNREDMTAIKQLAELPLPQPHEKDEVSLLQGAFVGMARRVALQWEKLAYQDQLRRDFVANISHDLRTPLTTLHGYLETLLYKGESLKSEESRRYLHIALSQSQKVSMLAQQLFELAQLEYGVIKPNREAFSLSELTYDVVQKFELMASTRNIRFVIDMPEQLPQVNADVSMIDRVLTNLFDNAIKHTPEAGIIEVTLRSAASEVEVSLKDSGPGIPDDLRATLFERPSALTHASTRKNSGGLGLMVVRRILQLHGRDIRLDDRVSGACFRFSVPR